MDIALARTFLEVVAQGSFVAAARKLHLTETAVSARIRRLEEQLDTTLFRRHRAGAVLTVAGERFVPHASSMLQVWERARHELALPLGRKAMVVLGCELSLWDPLLLDWLQWMSASAPELAVRAEVRSPRDLIDQITRGTLDIAIVYTPHHQAGLSVELLVEEKLVLVSTSAQTREPHPDRYVYVDWGLEFAEQHALAYPALTRPAVACDFGPLALELLLGTAGTGYFRLGAVRTHLEAGRLHLVPHAPRFAYPAYAVYATGVDETIVAQAMEGLRHAAGRRVDSLDP
jgi:Transcriptional regulator